MTQQDKEQLKLEIEHIFESEANEICACGSTNYYIEQHKDVTKYYCSKCH